MVKPVDDEGESQMRLLPKGNGSPEKGKPDKKTHHDFLGESKGIFQEIAGDHVGKSNKGHDGEEKGAETFFEVGEKPVNTFGHG
jgi:hypothetical protein